MTSNRLFRAASYLQKDIFISSNSSHFPSPRRIAHSQAATAAEIDATKLTTTKNESRYQQRIWKSLSSRDSNQFKRMTERTSAARKEDIKETPEDVTFTRRNCVTRDDIYNVINSLGLTMHKWHKNDAISVDLMVKDAAQHPNNPFFFYNPETTENAEFTLGHLSQLTLFNSQMLPNTSTSIVDHLSASPQSSPKPLEIEHTPTPSGIETPEPSPSTSSSIQPSTSTALHLDDGPYAGIFDKTELCAEYRAQYECEKRGSIVIPSAYATSTTKPNVYDSIYVELEDMWRRQLREKFLEYRQTRFPTSTKEQQRLQKRGSTVNYNGKLTLSRLPFVLNTDAYVEIMLNEAYRLSELTDSHGASVNFLCTSLGKKIMARIRVELAEREGIVEKLDETYERYLDYFTKDEWRQETSSNHREYWMQCLTDLYPKETTKTTGKQQRGEEDPLDMNTVLVGKLLTYEEDTKKMGELLYEIMIASLKCPLSLGDAVRAFKEHRTIEGTKMVDAFYKALSSFNLRYHSEIRAHSSLIDLKRRTSRLEVRFDAVEMPMICPPVPWSRHNNGQMLIQPVDLVRLDTSGQRSLKKVPRITPRLDDVRGMIDALNVLGSTPWTINTAVLDVMLEVFRGDGDSKLDIPTARAKLPPLPRLPKSIDKMRPDEKAQLMKKRQEAKKAEAEMYSLWCTALYRFSMADHLRHKILWFPHNVDFRGRTYPVPPYLNHMGDDVCRGMMQFAKGRPLGPHGLRWLKIHCINLTGFKKRASADERATYADEMIEEIYDSAQRPLTGRRWWTSSEEPWQTLAVCMEIERAVRSGAHESYVCRVPVHQDGSCNGLQHYAALGRDQQGAEQVNLAPASEPQDVYSAIAALIESKRAKDAADDLPIAKILDGFVLRKVIKQTVMTTVYGVTRYGGRAQIGRQLKDNEKFPREHVFQASAYLVQRLFESLGEIFGSARQIQTWFVQSAGLISGVLGRTVEWVTPMGFPVAQPYFKSKKAKKTTNADEDGTRMSATRTFAMYPTQKPNTFKQKNAFPPNYIHSLDSTHMMLTALECQRRGITYAAVHDSFWTHPSTVADMNLVCREQFIGLHSKSLLNDLSQFFVAYYIDPAVKEAAKIRNTKEKENRMEQLMAVKEHFESLPRLGEFDLKNVTNSTYFFS